MKLEVGDKIEYSDPFAPGGKATGTIATLLSVQVVLETDKIVMNSSIIKKLPKN